MDDHDQQQSLDRVAAALDRLVTRMDHQTTALEGATLAMRRHRWTMRVAVVAIVVAGLGGWRDIQDARVGSCERGNEVRAAVVRAAGTAVETAALELAGDDPDARAEASRIAARTVDQVARDRALAPQDC